MRKVTTTALVALAATAVIGGQNAQAATNVKTYEDGSVMMEGVAPAKSPGQALLLARAGMRKNDPSMNYDWRSVGRKDATASFTSRYYNDGWVYAKRVSKGRYYIRLTGCRKGALCDS